MESESTARGTGNGEIAVYQEKDGRVRLEVRLEGDTVWLSLAQMAALFGRDKSVISRHLRRVFDAGELSRRAVVAKNATTAADGKTYQVDYYNLDAILSVGYRVNSKRGTFASTRTSFGSQQVRAHPWRTSRLIRRMSGGGSPGCPPRRRTTCSPD
jgi:Virulence protein RhuM family